MSPKKTKTITTKPRQAMSPRQVDRTETTVKEILANLAMMQLDLNWVTKRVRDLLASTRRSERR